LRLLFGIGNPGAEYVGTRHNLGFELLQGLASGPFEPLSGHRADVSQVRVDALPAGSDLPVAQLLGQEAGQELAQPVGQEILLVRPLTYVNRCGPLLAELLEHYGLAIEHCLVAVDDLALPPGTLRLRGEGSDGGHNGLRSIQAALGTAEYPRLRLGVGGEHARAHPDYVLGRFPEEDLEAVTSSLDRAEQAVRRWAMEGLHAAMGEANRRVLDPDGNRP
jgi:PTH1 family peptidyl-tRNA hydrolase